MITRCVNLCEMDLTAQGSLASLALGAPASSPDGVEALVRRIAAEAGWPDCARLYLGSSFCGNAFLRNTESSIIQAVQAFSEAFEVPCTLTVPSVSEGELPAVKRRIDRLLEKFSCFDEVTVNDYGMLGWAAERGGATLNIGRLFSKDLRDLRYEEGFPRTYRPAFLGRSLDELQTMYPMLGGIELDPCGSKVDLTEAPVEVTPALHDPYLFVTTGAFCPYAPVTAQGLPARAGSPCAQQCESAVTTYRVESATPAGADADGRGVGEVFYTKHGKTVFMMNEAAPVQSRVPYRVIRAPRHFGWLLSEEEAR